MYNEEERGQLLTCQDTGGNASQKNHWSRDLCPFLLSPDRPFCKPWNFPFTAVVGCPLLVTIGLGSPNISPLRHSKEKKGSPAQRRFGVSRSAKYLGGDGEAFRGSSWRKGVGPQGGD